MDLSKYPKTLETKEDYLFIRENFPSKLWLEDFINLEYESMVDVVVGILKKTDSGFKIIRKLDLSDKKDSVDSETLTELIKGYPSYQVVYTGEFEEEPTWSIFECENRFFGVIHVEKEDSKMKRIGFTHEELLKLINGWDVLKEENKNG